MADEGGRWVYLLMEGDRDAEVVVGVYSTKEAAKAATGKTLTWRVLEDGETEGARDPRGQGWYYRIDPYWMKEAAHG